MFLKEIHILAGSAKVHQSQFRHEFCLYGTEIANILAYT